MTKSIYHNKKTCNKCAGKTVVRETDGENGVIYECETTCKDCGFNDYWAHGFFQSSIDGFDKCKKYQ